MVIKPLKFSYLCLSCVPLTYLIYLSKNRRSRKGWCGMSFMKVSGFTFVLYQLCLSSLRLYASVPVYNRFVSIQNPTKGMFHVVCIVMKCNTPKSLKRIDTATSVVPLVQCLKQSPMKILRENDQGSKSQLALTSCSFLIVSLQQVVMILTLA